MRKCEKCGTVMRADLVSYKISGSVCMPPLSPTASFLVDFFPSSDNNYGSL